MTTSNKPLVYLASPYSFNGHSSDEERARRFAAVTRVAAQLMKQGFSVFSPITHGHPINQEGVAVGWKTWAEIDKAILSNCCSRFMVLMLDGWQESEGIAEEMKIAKALKLQVTYLDPVKWISNEER